MTKKKQSPGTSKFARLSGVGLQMGATIFLGAYAGKFLDEKYSIKPRFIFYKYEGYYCRNL